MASKKRIGKSEVRAKSSDAGKIAAVLQREELVVQRLAAELNGKTPKYYPLRPREFVPYLFDDVTVLEIKSACHKFVSQMSFSLKNCYQFSTYVLFQSSFLHYGRKVPPAPFLGINVLNPCHYLLQNQNGDLLHL